MMIRIIIALILTTSVFAADKLETFVYAHGVFVNKALSSIVSSSGHILINKQDFYRVLVDEKYHLEVSLNNGKKFKQYTIANCSSDLEENLCLLKVDAKTIGSVVQSNSIHNFLERSIKGKPFQTIADFRISWIEGQKRKSKKLLEQKEAFSLNRFPSFDEGIAYQTNLWGSSDQSHCKLSKETELKKVYQCELISDHTGYEISIEKNIDKVNIAYLNDKSIWYKPTKELLPYVNNKRWKKIGLTKLQYRSLHMYQNNAYKCVAQLSSKSNMRPGQTYCVTTFQNSPSLGQVSIQYITQLEPTGDIIHISAYTLNKYKAAPLFAGARKALEDLRLVPIKSVINRLPASK